MRPTPAQAPEWRPVIDASVAATGQAVLVAFDELVAEGLLYNAFVARLDRENRIAQARPLTDELVRSLRREPTQAIAPLLAGHDVLIAPLSRVPSAAMAKSLLEERDAAARHLLIVDGDPRQPVWVFTLDVASSNPDGPPKGEADTLVLQARLSENAIQNRYALLIAGQAETFEVRLGALLDDAIAATGISRAQLQGRSVQFELTGHGLMFGGSVSGADGLSRIASPLFPVVDGQDLAFTTSITASDVAHANIVVNLLIFDGDDIVNGDPAWLGVKFSVSESLDQALAAIVGKHTAGQPLAQRAFHAPPPAISIHGEYESERLQIKIDGRLEEVEIPSLAEFDGGDSSFTDVLKALRALSKSYQIEQRSQVDELLTPIDAVARLVDLARIGRDLHALVLGRPTDRNRDREATREFFAKSSGLVWLEDGTPNLLWELLYDGDDPDDLVPDPAAPDEAALQKLRAGFWGYRFDIRHVVARGYATAHDRPQMLQNPPPTAAFLNRKALSKGKSEELNALNEQQVLDLVGAATTDQTFPDWLQDDDKAPCELLYLYGHGTGSGYFTPFRPTLDDPRHRSVQATLDIDQTYTVKEIGAWTKAEFNGSPIVFINACETMFVDHDGANPFVQPLYCDGQARAIIGCLAPVQAFFAIGFAHLVISDLLQGQRNLGACIHHAKRRLLDQNNPYGLLYTVYGRTDFFVGPAAASAEPAHHQGEAK